MQYPLEYAQEIADKIVAQMKPLCLRIEIAGSIRRKKPDVGDIEIVYIPKGGVNILKLYDIIARFPKIKGSPMGKYTQRRLPERICLDLFQATPENWGIIYAIRTGSAEFSHRVLACGWARKGYKSDGGVLYPVSKEGDPLYMFEEEDLFKFLGIEFVEPEKRI